VDPEFVLSKWPALKAYKEKVLARPAGDSVPLAWLDDPSAWLV